MKEKQYYDTHGGMVVVQGCGRGAPRGQPARSQGGKAEGGVETDGVRGDVGGRPSRRQIPFEGECVVLEGDGVRGEKV